MMYYNPLYPLMCFVNQNNKKQKFKMASVTLVDVGELNKTSTRDNSVFQIPDICS